MPKGSLEVSNYCPPAAAAPMSVPSALGGDHGRLCGSPWTVSLLAATASCALHVLTLSPVFLGGGAAYLAVRGNLKSFKGVSGEAATTSAMQWVMVEEMPGAGPSGGSNTTAAAFPNPPMRSVTLSEATTDISVVNYPLQRPGEENKGDDGPTASDLYINRIKAEVDRAWLRPRVPLDVPFFSCRARIAQDLSGNVREITLELCTADASWQRSLTRAIEAASPLPAPPDPNVFTRVLRLTFEAETYSTTDSPDRYAPTLAGAAERPPARPAVQRDPGT